MSKSKKQIVIGVALAIIAGLLVVWGLIALVGQVVPAGAPL